MRFVPALTAKEQGLASGPVIKVLLRFREPFSEQVDDARYAERCLADFQGAYLHDWQADPFACGAHSYAVAGGGNARELPERPLASTLFFTGEAPAQPANPVRSRARSTAANAPWSSC